MNRPGRLRIAAGVALLALGVAALAAGAAAPDRSLWLEQGWEWFRGAGEVLLPIFVSVVFGAGRDLHHEILRLPAARPGVEIAVEMHGYHWLGARLLRRAGPGADRTAIGR